MVALFSLSISGSILALLLFGLRPLLKSRVSKTFQYYIWLLVLLRLVLPLSFNGSIMNQIISQTILAQMPVASVAFDHDPTQEDVLAQADGRNAVQGSTPSETTPSGNALPALSLSAAAEPVGIIVGKFILRHLTSLWLLGATLYFGRFVLAYLRFSRKIRRTSIRPHPKDKEVFARLRGSANIRLVCNAYIDTPMLMGFLSPRIVIPHLAFVASGMKPELEHILRHELTHYRRHDLLYKWVAVFVSSVHWFNPLMILLRREISRACELSCDEAVIRALGGAQRQGYGETLLAIASNQRLPAGVVTTTMCEGKRELKERLESIMTYKGKNVLTVTLSVVLSLLLAGCSVTLGAASINSPAENASPSPAPTDVPVTLASPFPTPGISAGSDGEASPAPAETSAPGAAADPSSSSANSENTQGQALANASVSEAYRAVLQNQAAFFSTDNQKSLYWNDFLTNGEIYATTFQATRFTVLDMDGDGVPEVVIELSVGTEPQFYEVLHDTDGTVHGYLIVYRGLEALKADGTFSFSSGAADNGWGKLILGTNAYETDMLGYSQSSQGDAGLTISYFIGDKPATKKAFDSFAAEQSRKSDAAWQEFSQKNMEAALSAME